MEHVAIMKKSWGLTKKILDGRKIIESRWYLNKHRPWNAIKTGDIVYFKDSCETVKLKAEASNVLQFSDLTPAKVKEILNKYGQDDGIEKKDISKFFKLFKNKKYCILVFLNNPTTIAPFDIDKTGFGAMSSWIVVDNVSKIKKHEK